jgi:hypothetical protein
MYKITLNPTPEGFRAFRLKLKAKIGPNLKAALAAAFLHDDWDPHDTRIENLHSLIYDEIVKGMDGNDALLLRMTTACGEKGPKCLKWLQDYLDPDNTATEVITLMKIQGDNLGLDTVAGIEEKIDLNNSLPPRMQISDTVLCALMLTKMPAELTHLRDRIVDTDVLPTMDEFLKRVKKAVHFCKPVPARQEVHSFVMTTPPSTAKRVVKCVNCNALDHVRKDCKEIDADCVYCGKKAGHLTEYCFVGQTGALPGYLSEERKKKIYEMRANLKLVEPPAAVPAEQTAGTSTMLIDASGGNDADYGLGFVDYYK